jgi:peptide/nickel transport system substrate-binding protein
MSTMNQRAIFNRRVKRRALLASSGSVAVLAACHQQGGANSGTSGAAGKPKTGGHLNVAMPADPYDFDPTGKPSENQNAIKPAYDSLLSYKTGPGVNPAEMILQPAIAEKWESPDGQTYIFHLRQGVQFANLPPVNGRAVTVEDARWSIQYHSRTGPIKQDKKLFPALNTWAFEGMDSVETPDDKTLTIHFGAPFVPFLNYIAQYWFPILPHEVYDADGNFSNRIVGTGPWQLDPDQSQRGTRWVYKRNPTYFGSGLPYLDQLNWLIIKDDETQNAAFRAKQIDILGADHSTVDDTTVDQIARENPSASRLEYPSTKGGIVYINANKPPINDLRVRKAVAFALNRSDMVKTYGGGTAGWAAAAETPGFFTQQELEQLCVYDVNQAKQLLAQAGYANGVDIEIINPGADRGQKEVGMIQLFQAQMKLAGINIVYHPLDRASEGNRKKSHDFYFDMTAGGASDDIDAALYANFYSKSDKNYGATNDPDLDKLLIAQRQELDENKRRDIVRQAVRRIYDQVWALSFFFPGQYQFAQPYVKNYAPHSFARGLNAVQTWLDRS